MINQKYRLTTNYKNAVYTDVNNSLFATLSINLRYKSSVMIKRRKMLELTVNNV